ncbi:MAG: glycosyltransferase, partial [Burkholderiaceae bacterium]|nr:glycosyltransferase [Burkholderiaceae bacterium]
MKTALPLVSVVVPTFNSCERMRPALESLAAQTERDFEVIVSDGASSDGTLALIETYRPQLPAL